jgi:hypothetical protein
MMQLFKSLLLFFVLSAQLPVIAQFHPMLGGFSVFEYQGEVYLSWTIVRGNTCNGIQIERSSNNQFFDVIGDIPGICGSADFDQSYDWIDRSPLSNSTNYYRLELGFNGHSESISVEVISLPEGGYQVRPNPMTNNGLIYFRNSSGRPHQLEIFELSGRPVGQYTTNGNNFQIEASALSNGLYLFTIRNRENNSAISGKFSVSR